MFSRKEQLLFTIATIVFFVVYAVYQGPYTFYFLRLLFGGESLVSP